MRSATSAALAPLFAAAPRPVEVAAATGSALYLATGDPDVPALCVTGPDAVRVPCAVVVTAVPPPAPAVLGAGSLVIGALTIRVGRWWRPSRPARRPISPAVAVHLAGLVRATRSIDPHSLLGRGQGLTPLGDDILAGALVTLRALGEDAAADRLAARVDALAPGRTTFVSAALLRHAGRGECVPQLAAVLDSSGPAVGPAVEALLGVGHTSGTGLARGVLAALAVTGRWAP